MTTEKTGSIGKERLANMEIPRIISMILIVSLHYFTLTGVENRTGFNLYIAQGILSVAYCCVNIFVLLSGWFYKSDGSSTFKKSVTKSAYLWSKTVVYSFLLIIVLFVVTKKPPYLGQFKEAVIPVSSRAYWFLTTYIVLALLTPFIDKFIGTLSYREHGFIVLLSVVILSVPATFFPKKWLIDNNEGYSIIWFVALYIIGAFLRRYSQKKQRPKYVYVIGFAASCLTAFVYWIVVRKLCAVLHFTDRSTRVFRYTSLPILVAAVCVILFFSQVRIKSKTVNKIVNEVSSVTFDVYIIHCYKLIGANLFINVLKCDRFYDSPFMILHFAASVLLIYLSCTAIGLIFKAVFGRPLKKFSEKIGTLFDSLRIKIISKWQS